MRLARRRVREKELLKGHSTRWSCIRRRASDRGDQGISQFSELASQLVDLMNIEKMNACYVTVLVVELELFCPDFVDTWKDPE